MGSCGLQVAAKCVAHTPYEIVWVPLHHCLYPYRNECQEQIYKFAGARYKKFATKELAQEFVNGADNPAEGRQHS